MLLKYGIFVNWKLLKVYVTFSSGYGDKKISIKLGSGKYILKKPKKLKKDRTGKESLNQSMILHNLDE